MKGARQIMPFPLRLTKEMREWFEVRAEENGRSMNAEIIMILRGVMRDAESKQAA